MRPAQDRILVLPEGGLYLAFRLLPILGRAGLAVDVLCLRDDPVARSRHVSRVLRVDSPSALARRADELLAAPDRPWRTVVVADERLARRLFARTAPADLAWWQPGALDPVGRDFLLGKFGLVAGRECWNLPIPPSRICTQAKDVLAFGDEIGWPIIVKPPDQWGGAGVRRLDSEDALHPRNPALAYPVLAQRFLHGRPGVVDLLCSRGRALAWLTSYSTRKGPHGLGPSTARLFQPLPALEPLIHQIAARTRFEGFCGFDWVEETATGQPWLTEFHPRPPSGFRFGRDCGVDFSAAVRHWIQGRKETFPPQRQAPGAAVAAHYFPGDLTRCLRERDWHALRAWLPGSKTRHDVPWDDLPVLAARLSQRLTTRWRRPQPACAGEFEMADVRDL